MSDVAIHADHLLDLAEAVCGQTASQNDLVELKSLLLVDQTSCRRYLLYCEMHAALRFEVRADRAAQKVCQQVDIKSITQASPEADLPDVDTPFPVPNFLSSTLHNTLGCFPEGMPLAYLIASVVTGLGILVASRVYVSRVELVAHHSVPASVVAEPASVGRITGTVGCKWETKGLGIRDWELEKDIRTGKPFRVSLGDKLALASGLLEITYDTGAKVILQGPVTYEVGANGGYLAMGKLTGKLERRVASGQWPVVSKFQIPNPKFEISNPQSLIPNPFVIRTPTAVVTDLGTEFGVEVSKDGATDTHVFAGEVRITTGNTPNDAEERSEVIRTGHSARVGRSEGLSLDKHQPEKIAKRFIRVMPGRLVTADAYAELVLSMNPVVYYRMEEWPKGKDEDTYVLLDSAPAAHHGEMHLGKEQSYPTRYRGKFGLALGLHGWTRRDYAIVPDYPKTEDGRLSASAWVWPEPVEENAWTGFVANWWGPVNYDRQNLGQFYLGIHALGGDLMASVHDKSGEQVIAREGAERPLRYEVWHHVAFVADGSALRLYHNGVEVATAPYRGIERTALPKALGIGCQLPDLGSGHEPGNPSWFCGRIDEVAVFNHPLTAEQVRQLYTGSVTDNTRTEAESPMAERGGNDKHP